MRRVLCVYLPLWAIERHRGGRKDKRPVLVVERSRGRELVRHASTVALRAGVKPGMTVAHARALLSTEPTLLAHDPDGDYGALLRLAHWATRWSPCVQAEPLDGLSIDISGCEHLFGGERVMARSIGRALSRAGLTVRVAVAGTVGAAWALSRFSPCALEFAESGMEQEAVSALPVESLRIDPQSAESLHVVNVMRVSELLSLPRSSLASRYGESVLRRVDQLIGDIVEPIPALIESPTYAASIDLDGGTTRLESVMLAVRSALGSLSDKLEARCVGLLALSVELVRVDAKRLEVLVQVSRVTRDTKHLWSLLAPRLERAHLGFGVERVELRALRVASLPHMQRGIDRSEDSGAVDGAFASMLDTLTNRLGSDRVLRAELAERHIPERGFNFVRVEVESKSQGEQVVLALQRPSLLHSQPEPIRVISLSPDGPVMRFVHRGSEHGVLLCDGPERIGGEWWRVREPARDYFRVQDEAGRWLWVYREAGTGNWFIHGEWA